jgi:hypothetical protein
VALAISISRTSTWRSKSCCNSRSDSASSGFTRPAASSTFFCRNASALSSWRERRPTADAATTSAHTTQTAVANRIV